MPDVVAEYFGAHVASFFHFYNSFTRRGLYLKGYLKGYLAGRWLVVPAILSPLFPLARHFGFLDSQEALKGSKMCNTCRATS